MPLPNRLPPPASRTATCLLTCCLLAPMPAVGQDVPAPMAARRLAGQNIKVDGHLDEAAWSQADWRTDFRQKEPVEGAAPTVSTAIAFLYDDEALYVGARMASRDPARLSRAITRRDQRSDAEVLVITLDTYHDRRTGYSFVVSSGGVRTDYYHPQDSEYNRDFAFDPVWTTRVAVDSAGWTAEMRIPFSQLRFNAAPMQTWGLNINRWIPSQNEDLYWVVVPRNAAGYLSHIGTLTGLADLAPSRRIELLPYSAANATFNGNRAAANPFDNGHNFTGRAGADLKLGLGPNLTLDATVNPDFGQVEADPAEVNLSAFETFFSERRPFFTEGSQLLRGNGPNYFYSRRIGAAPRGGISGDFVDRPNNSTILSAAKVTGRLASGLSLGALTAVTARETAVGFDTATAQRTEAPVEPASAYTVVRLQQEFGRDASTAGVTLTGVRRFFQDGDNLSPLINRTAVTGGGDWRLRFQGGTYEVSGHIGFSHIAGDSLAIRRAQTSSARYYQRPDADHVRLDTSREALTGYTARLRADKNGGRHWLWGAEIATESPGFELNDIGRLRRADRIGTVADLQFRETTPGALFRNYRIGVFGNAGWNYGWERQDTRFAASTNLTWLNFWGTFLGAWIRPESQSDNLTRGGPSMGVARSWGADFQMQNNFAATTRWEIGLSGARDRLGGWSYSVQTELSGQLGSRWQVELEPRYLRSLSPRQYVAARANGPAETFGTRYIFGFVEQTVLSTRVRLNYAFTPDLTLEGYLEPFAASGRYTRHGELAAARSTALRTYGTDGTTITAEPGGYRVTDPGQPDFVIPNQDFNVLSFNSNLVMRWEWRPGSTFYLVWQQQRGSYCTEEFASSTCAENRTRYGQRVGVGSLGDVFKAVGSNFLAVKVAYWLPIG